MDARILDQVDPRWRDAFVRFVETGEADEAFLEYLSRDERAQQAVEQAFGTYNEALTLLASAFEDARPAAAERGPGAAPPEPPPTQRTWVLAFTRRAAVYLTPAAAVACVALLFLVQRYTQIVRTTESSLREAQVAYLDASQSADQYKQQLVEVTAVRDDYHLQLARLLENEPAAVQREAEERRLLLAENQRLRSQFAELTNARDLLQAQVTALRPPPSSGDDMLFKVRAELEEAKVHIKTLESEKAAIKKDQEAASASVDWLFDYRKVADDKDYGALLGGQLAFSWVKTNPDGTSTVLDRKAGATSDGRQRYYTMTTSNAVAALTTNEGRPVSGYVTCFGLPEGAARPTSPTANSLNNRNRLITPSLKDVIRAESKPAAAATATSQ